MGKVTNSKFGKYIHRVHPIKSPLKILEKKMRRHFQELLKFFEYPLLSQEGVKLQTSNFVCTFLVSIGTKAFKISGKVAASVFRDSQKFSGHPCRGRIMWSSLR